VGGVCGEVSAFRKSKPAPLAKKTSGVWALIDSSILLRFAKGEEGRDSGLLLSRFARASE